MNKSFYKVIDSVIAFNWKYGTEIEVIDNTEKTEQKELVEDLVQIITVFSCKLQGKRAKHTRELIEQIKGGD